MAQYVFPKVEPADIKRSRRDLSLPKHFTASVGTLIPCLSVDMLPSDWMRINTLASVQTLPMVAPVKGRWKVSFDYYYNPWSNIYGFMDNNSKLTTQQILNSYRYVFSLGESVSSSSAQTFFSQVTKVPRGGVLDFLGCPVGYFGEAYLGTDSNYRSVPTLHPAESLLTYIDIFRNYYVNNQLSGGVFVSTGDVDYSGNPINYRSYTADQLDELFVQARYFSNKALPDTIAVTQLSNALDNYLRNAMGNVDNQDYPGVKIYSQNGLFLRSYRMDLLRGIMNASVDDFKAKVDIQTDGLGGSFFTMDQVFFADKLQAFINRIDITGGRFSDWIRTRWNIDSDIQVDRPIYLGSHSLWLNTVDVIATASGETNVGSRNDSSVVGQQVGYQVGKMTVGKGKDRQRPITIKSKQYGTLMCIFSIVPDVVYSQGFELNMLKTKFADIFDPAFSQLGFQDVLRGEMYAFPAVGNVGGTLDMAHYHLTDVVGKRVAWSEYMASLGRSHGDFAYGCDLDYWVNNRIYAKNPGNISALGALIGPIADIMHDFDSTTYVYPHLWNRSFADTSVSAMNYLVDVYFQIDANRALGKRLMPHL